MDESSDSGNIDGMDHSSMDMNEEIKSDEASMGHDMSTIYDTFSGNIID